MPFQCFYLDSTITYLCFALKQDVAAVIQDIAAYQRPAGVLIMRQSLTIEGGELTTNVKLRCIAVKTKYEEASAGYLQLSSGARPMTSWSSTEYEDLFLDRRVRLAGLRTT